MASLKLCCNVSGKKTIRRARIESVDDFTFSALKKIVADTFPDLTGAEELGYEDDDGELVTLSNDSDVRECMTFMDVATKKSLRIEIITQDYVPAGPKLMIETGTAGLCVASAVIPN